MEMNIGDWCSTSTDSNKTIQILNSFYIYYTLKEGL